MKGRLEDEEIFDMFGSNSGPDDIWDKGDGYTCELR
jgi:hypothetical protein